MHRNKIGQKDMLLKRGSPLSLFLVPRFLLPRDDQGSPSCREGYFSEPWLPPCGPTIAASKIKAASLAREPVLQNTGFEMSNTDISVPHICSTKDLFSHTLVPQTNTSALLAP